MITIKKMFSVGAVLLFAIACTRETIVPVETITPENQAYLKVVHASAFGANPAVQLKVNDERVSSNITYATPFPGGGLNTTGNNLAYYLSVNPGAVKISMSVPRAGTNQDQLMLYSNTINLATNKYYSAYITDTAANTQTVLVEENVNQPPLGGSRYKFVNLLPNLTALDLYAGSNKVASNIAYKAVSPDFTLKTSDTVRFYLRLAGAAAAATPLAVYPSLGPPIITAYTVPNGRAHTVFARGYSGTTGTRAPAISLLSN